MVEQRVRELVAERRPRIRLPTTRSAASISPTTRLTCCSVQRPQRGCAVDHEQLAGLDADAQQAERTGTDVRLRRLTRQAGLTPLDVELLMIALLPDLDSRFERLYGYLNDDVTRRRASVGLALQLAGVSGLSAVAAPAGAESAAGQAGSGARRGHRSSHADPRSAGAGSGRCPSAGRQCTRCRAGWIDHRRAGYRTDLSTQLAHALAAGVRLIHLKERVTGSGAATAVAALAELGTAAVVLILRASRCPRSRMLSHHSLSGRRCWVEPG